MLVAHTTTDTDTDTDLFVKATDTYETKEGGGEGREGAWRGGGVQAYPYVTKCFDYKVRKATEHTDNEHVYYYVRSVTFTNKLFPCR